MEEPCSPPAPPPAEEVGPLDSTASCLGFFLRRFSCAPFIFFLGPLSGGSSFSFFLLCPPSVLPPSSREGGAFFFGGGSSVSFQRPTSPLSSLRFPEPSAWSLLVLPSLWHFGHSQQFGISSLMMPSAFPILRQLGWMISLQMVHSIRDRLNFSSSESTVSSFPASPHAKHTAV